MSTMPVSGPDAWPDPGPVRRHQLPAPRPRLTVVPAAPARVGRAPFVLLVCALLAGGLLTLLMLNTVLAQDAFVLHDLQKHTSSLTDEEAALRRSLAEEAAPGRLADQAARLGMVPDGHPSFLRPSDGALLPAPGGRR